MNKKSTLSEIMTRNLIVGHKDTKLEQLLEFFSVYKIQHLPIVEGQHIVGILSLNDVVDFVAKHLLNDHYSNFKIMEDRYSTEAIMTANPTTMKSSDLIVDAVRLMREKKFQAIPIEDDGVLVGIVSNNDMLKFCDYLAS